jgi:hypothetical protein
MVLVIDLGCGPSSLIRCVIREVPRTIDEKTAQIGRLAWTSCDERVGFVRRADNNGPGLGATSIRQCAFELCQNRRKSRSGIASPL